MMRKALAAGMCAGLVLFSVTTSAFADSSVTAWQKGQTFREGAASAAWVNVPDSPSDSNRRAFQVVIPADGVNDCQNTTGPNYCYAGFYSKASINKVLAVGAQKNLSFEFSASNPVNATSRIGVQFNSGDVAYLDPVTCSHDIAVSGGSWKRADFTGFKSNCSFTVSGETAGCTRPMAPAAHGRSMPRPIPTRRSSSATWWSTRRLPVASTASTASASASARCTRPARRWP